MVAHRRHGDDRVFADFEQDHVAGPAKADDQLAQERVLPLAGLAARIGKISQRLQSGIKGFERTLGIGNVVLALQDQVVQPVDVDARLRRQANPKLHALPAFAFPAFARACLDLACSSLARNSPMASSTV